MNPQKLARYCEKMGLNLYNKICSERMFYEISNTENRDMRAETIGYVQYKKSAPGNQRIKGILLIG